LLVAVAYGIASWLYTITGTRLGQRFVAELRKRVAEKVALLPLNQQNRLGAGELQDRVLVDTERLRHFLDHVFIRTGTNLVRIGYPVAMLLIIDARLAMISLSVIPLQWLIVWRLQKRIQPLTREILARQSALTGYVKEGLDGAETIKALRAEEQRLDGAGRRINDVETCQKRANHLTALIRGAVWLMTSLGIALIWWFGGRQVAAGAMTLGTLVVFAGFVEFSYRPFRFFPQIIEHFEQGRASLSRIQQLLDMPADVGAESAVLLEAGDGRIEFRNLTFAWRDEPVLNEIDLVIEPRQFTAIVGRSGSGKSTLLRLLPRLYDAAAGKILIDGCDIRDVSLASLRSQVAYVPQSPITFSGTIRENLRLAAPEAATTELETACEQAGALEFIDSLPLGFETPLGADRVQLSGGEAQRLAIARALLADARILLLDEPTSALDGRTQDVVVKALQRLKDRMTIVLVGHRVETFRDADRIVLLEAGELIDIGTHEELLVRSPQYSELLSESWNEETSVAD
jgi:ABC-type multidrug transport system fused ATPase/permease subunit